jgi:putative ABC transport system permease protein
MLDRLYRRFPTLLIARRNLSRTKTRSVLAMLGIVIGVVAIASLGVFGTTLQTAAVGSLGDIGNEVIVSPNPEAGVQSLTERDVREIERSAGDAAVVPLKQRQDLVTYQDNQQFTVVYGMRNPGDTFTASDGRIPDPLRSGAVVGASLAENLDVRTGNSITVGNRTYRVRAVLESESGLTILSTNNAVIVPAESFNESGYSQVIVTAESGTAANESAVAIREALNDREERVSIFELGQITAQIGEFFGILNTFLIAIGSISLVVAGVSILNVMLMSTIERREEIGVLRAVGYQQFDVLKIMLSEALLLGAIGGSVGAVLSLGAGLLINEVALDDPMQVFQPANLGFLLLALAFGIGTSVLSGLYPAWKAAKDRPVDALRK